MTEFFKMDAFFVVATIATVVIAAITIVALVYAVRFLRTINRVADEIEEEADATREVIKDARKSVRGFRFGQLFSLFRTRAKKK